jgi:4-hydroxybenzoate polyprenyltransferase
MRSAGCVINDYADRHLDGHVKRTQGRPLPSGRVTVKETLLLFVILCLCAFVLVLFTNTLTIMLSFGGVALAACYPFMKRVSHMPQLVLGAAFAWAIPMAFAAQTGVVPPHAWLIYTATVLWTVAYDTMYAMVDRDDDLKIGIKSTAILFGSADRLIVAILQALVLITLVLLGHNIGLGSWYFGSVLAMGLLFVYQQYLIRHREREACLQAFLNNHWAGSLVFVGIFLHFLFNP